MAHYGAPARISIPFLNFRTFLLDDDKELPRAREKFTELLNELLRLGELVLNLFALQPREPRELHFQNCVSLQGRECEAGAKICMRFGGIPGFFNELDNLVNAVQRFFEPQENVFALFGALQVMACAPGHNRLAVL